MYAIFAEGGKQHRVEVGTTIDIEKLNASTGDTVELSKVLALSDGKGNSKIGEPYIENATVVGEVLGEVKSKKIIVFRSNRRKGFKRKLGHRQKLTRLRITELRN